MADSLKPQWTAPAMFAGAILVLVIVVVSAVREIRPPVPPSPKSTAEWTTSRIRGTPEPPPPFKAVRAFPNLKIKNPVLIARAAGGEQVFGRQRLFVADQNGKFYSFPTDEQVKAADVFLDLSQAPLRPDVIASPARLEATYGLVFPPDFATNRVCYVCYVLAGKPKGDQLPDGSRVSRFKVTDTDPPKAIPESEEVIITWLGGGHNGGDLHFGPDGCLYISTGDGSFPNPPDALLAGQDMSNLLCSILRIDVRQPEGNRKYTIPADNPFAQLAGARGEIWSYGFRNPWRMSFDSGTGDLWVGDVGWESYETVHRIEKGGNYGWSIMEGPQPVRTELAPGPTPILPPAIAIPHADGASVTGGYVYRGKNFPELVGKYIYGDWETRRVWAATWDGKQVTSHPDIMEPTVRVSAFGLDYDDELLLFDYDDGTLHRLERNPDVTSPTPFPQTLSESGLFASVKDHTPAAGLAEFEINAEMWADHATAERFVALPAGTSIGWFDKPEPIAGSMFSRTLDFPANAVLLKTLSLEMEAGRPESRKRIETQLLHYTGRGWRPYTFAWNEDATDAVLVPAEGQERLIKVRDPKSPGGVREQTWSYAGRAACQRCHNPWAEHTLAFNVRQLNRDWTPGYNQLTRLQDHGLLQRRPSPSVASAEGTGSSSTKAELPPLDLAALPRLTPPFDSSADLNDRARAYLHANCGHCHRMGGGGTADIDLTLDQPLDKTKTLGVRPLQGTFGIHDAQILCAGDPYRSILFYRISKIGRGRMPHVGSEVVDERGSQLIYDWIRQLPIRSDEVALIQRLKELDEPTALAKDAEQRDAEIARIAGDIAKEAGRDKPNDADRTAATGRQQADASNRAAQRQKDRAETVLKLMSSPSSALLLSRSLGAAELPPGVTQEIVAAGASQTDPIVRDLFEPFIPYEKRSKKLGNVIRPQQILALTGDGARGRELFLNTNGVACKNCHRIGQIGSALGPDLSQIGKKYGRTQILESLLEPSKFIEPKYVPYLVETVQGRVVTGLLTERTDKEVVLRDAQDKEVRIANSDVEQIRPQRQSLMPDLLLRDLTAQQVADLVALLESLNSGPVATDDANWRTLPLIKDGQVDPGWSHTGWGGFVVDGDSLRTECDEKGMGLLTYTKEKFGDCQIRVVYKSKEPKSNAGIFIRIDDGALNALDQKPPPAKRDAQGKLLEDALQQMMDASEKELGPWYAVHHGFEVQICDDADEGHRTGAVYSLSKAARAPAKPDGEWRTMTITLKGTEVLVDIDGQRVSQFDSEKIDASQTRQWYEPKREPKRPAAGFIGLQNHDPGDVVWFKEVSVRPLDPK